MKLIYLIMISLFFIRCSDNPSANIRYTDEPPTTLFNKLVDIWNLDSTSLPYGQLARIPSFCNNLKSDTDFIINSDSSITIIPKDSSRACNTYSFYYNDSSISLIEYDMVMVLGLKFRTDSTIEFKSNFWPDHSFRYESPYVLFLSNQLQVNK